MRRPSTLFRSGDEAAPTHKQIALSGDRRLCVFAVLAQGLLLGLCDLSRDPQHQCIFLVRDPRLTATKREKLFRKRAQSCRVIRRLPDDPVFLRIMGMIPLEPARLHELHELGNEIAGSALFLQLP